jgi:P-type E1-E2 ATPase
MNNPEFGRLKSQKIKDILIYSNLNFLGVLAMKDELRSSSISAVSLAAEGKIVVRLISGDNLETAKFFARQSGILTEDMDEN